MATNTQNKDYKIEVAWTNVFIILLVASAAIIGQVYLITKSSWLTFSFMAFLEIYTAIGIQCGAHRLWSHKSYKAKLPLQIILAISQTMSGQNHIYDWCQLHRLHHKYADTDGDPHNPSRGFFFAHIGWLLCKNHPEFLEKYDTVDMSDLKRDPLVIFQRKYYIPLVILTWGIIPTLIPYYLWNEDIITSLFTCVFLRYFVMLNLTLLVNSAGHMWGTKPYDTKIQPVECTLKPVMMGEGFHNFHHTFAWDYSASELGPSQVYNPGTAFINLCSKIGWAYDLRKVSALKVQEKKDLFGDKSTINELKTREYLIELLMSVSHVILPMILKIVYQNIYPG